MCLNCTFSLTQGFRGRVLFVSGVNTEVLNKPQLAESVYVEP